MSENNTDVICPLRLISCQDDTINYDKPHDWHDRLDKCCVGSRCPLYNLQYDNCTLGGISKGLEELLSPVVWPEEDFSDDLEYVARRGVSFLADKIKAYDKQKFIKQCERCKYRPIHGNGSHCGLDGHSIKRGDPCDKFEDLFDAWTAAKN